MNIQKRLIRWEHTVERSPKSAQLQLFGVVFIISLAIGYLISAQLSVFEHQMVAQTLVEIQQLETQRMQERIDELRISRYARG